MNIGFTIAIVTGLLLATTTQPRHLTVPASVKPVSLHVNLAYSEQDLNCLAANIYHEARGESLQGQQAVAAVTINRVKSKKYPKTVCAVVEQRRQFSWLNNLTKKAVVDIRNNGLKLKKPLEVLAYQRSLKVAKTALESNLNVLPQRTLWYHADYVNPAWNKNLIKVKTVGKHVFYQDHMKV